MSDRWSGPVVGLVCSAGGLDALSQVLGSLPGDFPAATVVVQHMKPTSKSLLAGILNRRSSLAIDQAVDGAPLRSGHVLVTPPGHHALVTTEATVRLIPSGEYPPNRPSADLLLTSLALTVGPHAIAVVMSGHGP